MKFTKLAILGAIVLPVTAVVASAAGPNPAFKARHDLLEGMGKAMKSTGDELKKPAPNVDLIKANANTLAASAPKLARLFPKGTGPEAGVKTEALPAIWERPADFKAANDRLVAASKGFQAAAATGDLAKIGPAMGQLGGSCKGCHDNFRKPRT